MTKMKSRKLSISYFPGIYFSFWLNIFHKQILCNFQFLWKSIFVVLRFQIKLLFLSQTLWLIRCTWSLGHRLSVYGLVYHFLPLVHKLLLSFFILHFQTMIPPNSIQFPFPLLKAKEKYEIKCKVKDFSPKIQKNVLK